MDAGNFDGTRHRQDLAAARQRRIHDVLELLVGEIPAQRNNLRARRRQEQRDVAHVAERTLRGRDLHVHEPDRPIVRARRERGACRGNHAVRPWPHEQRVHCILLGRPHPRRDPIDRQPLQHEAKPDEHYGDPVLQQHGLRPTRPQGVPQRQRRREGARGKQPSRIAPLVARSVIAENDEAEKQRARVLPAVQHAGGEHGLEPLRQRWPQ